MVEIKTFGSSSKGNCYLLTEGGSSLLIEAGVNPSKLKIPWSQVDGILLTHEHQDHGKYINQVLKRCGANVASTKGTLDALDVPDHRRVEVDNDDTLSFLTGNEWEAWHIEVFDVEHDAADPVGFVITSPNGKVILFATDTYYIRYRFSYIDIAMIECNYDLVRLEQRFQLGHIDKRQYSRILRSHFALDHVIKFFNANNSWQGDLEEVHLLHLSDRNSDAEYFRQEIAKVTGVPVYIAGEEEA